MVIQQVSYRLGKYESAVEAAWRKFCDDDILQRIWDKDQTVWQQSPAEVADRMGGLGWLDCPQDYRLQIPALKTFAQQVCNDGIKQVVLLGMGGSSLGAEVLAKVFGPAPGFPRLSVLDTTDPQAISDVVGKLDFQHSLFLVCTKSGSTVETVSLFKYCYNQCGEALGYEQAAQHFVAITDPGSQLEVTAKKLGFRQVFLNDPNIGGRYSVLSYFGLVPAALLGLDLNLLLGRAEAMANLDRQAVGNQQRGAYLGVVLGALAKQGCNKLTVLCDPQVAAFGPWLEQLLSESSGKQGQGVLPVLDNKPMPPEQYRKDRLFVFIEMAGEKRYGAEASELAIAGFPVIQVSFTDAHCLGAEFFRWQMATACLCHIIGVNPFDQPDVESAKLEARRIVEQCSKPAGLPFVEPCIRQGSVSLYCEKIYGSLEAALDGLVGDAEGLEYVAVLAYLNPNPLNTQLLKQLCTELGKHTKAPVTLGFGPGYLHSTGQLHKGGMAGGRFLIISAKDESDLGIPDEPGGLSHSLSFGALKHAQALGDQAALIGLGKDVLRLHFDCSVADGVEVLLDAHRLD